MPTDNRLAADIETAGTKARYDAGMKNLLAYSYHTEIRGGDGTYV